MELEQWLEMEKILEYGKTKGLTEIQQKRSIQAINKVHPNFWHLLTHSLKVKDLLQIGSREWNKELLELLFPRKERDLIAEIRPGGGHNEDKYTWDHTRSDIYTVKSGY